MIYLEPSKPWVPERVFYYAGCLHIQRRRWLLRIAMPWWGRFAEWVKR